MDEAAENIKATQKKRKQDYDHRHLSKTEVKVDDILLLKNNKRFDRKGGKFSQKWLGPYTVVNISDKGVATLKNASELTLKKTCNVVQLKHYIQGADKKSKSTSNDRVFWKTKVCQPNKSSLQVTLLWLKNELYERTEADRDILESKDVWLNNNLMGAEQKFICKLLVALKPTNRY